MVLPISSLLTLDLRERKKMLSSPGRVRGGSPGRVRGVEGGAVRGTSLLGGGKSCLNGSSFGCGWGARAGFAVEIALRERNNVDDRCHMGVEA